MSVSLGAWVEARDTGATGRGRGLFATQNIPAGQVVLVDSPIVAVQLSSTEEEFGVGSARGNERGIRACAHCLTQIGTAAEQIQKAAGLASAVEIPGLETINSAHKSCAVSCDQAGCSAEWCSAECHEADAAMHSVVHSAAYEPVLRFGDDDNRVFDTASRCLVAALAGHVRTHLPISEVLTSLRDCVSGDWAAMVDVPEEVDEDEIEDFRDAMREKISEGHALFAAAIKASDLAARADPSAVHELLDPGLFAHVVGALHLNSFRCDIEDDPVLGILEAVAAAPEEHRSGLIAALTPALHGIVEMGDDESNTSEDELTPDALLERAIEAAPTLCGTGLYPQLRFCNHSCEPNAEVRFCESAVGELVAMEDIAVGTELLISYCESDDLAVEERAIELQGYGIVCDCPRCQRERS